MDAEEKEDDQPSEEQQRPAVAGRPPLTLTVNVIHLQKKLKDLVKGSFEFRNSRNGTRVVTREMLDYSAIRAFFDDQKYHYFTFHAKVGEAYKGSH
jgi:hypothetical protein